MSRANRGRGWLIGSLAAIVCLAILYSMGTKAMGAYKFEQLTQKMKTVCVGRFLIDLPASMDTSYSHTFISGFWVSAIPESQGAFIARLAGREAELAAQLNEKGRPNLEKVAPVDANGLSGKIFTFGRTRVEGLESQKPVHYVNVALEGYVHGAGTTIVFKAEDVDAGRTDVLATIIDKVRVVAPNEIPTAPGFCFGLGMLIDPVPVEWTEGVALFAGYKEQPDLALVLHTRAGLGKDPNDPGRLARNARADAEMPLWQRPLLTKLRIGHRTINGVAGEEVLERGRELNSIPVYSFDWEVTGTKNDVLLPAMHLEMSSGHPVAAGSPPVLSFFNEDALIHLWDKISSSIRVRPTAPVARPASDLARPGVELGETTTAGDECPETGWWECADGRRDTRVLGGQRQFLVKGQRVPQALLLPPQTLWDKVRRVQTSYESPQRTTWSFVDRRSRARLPSDIPLAPALCPPSVATPIASAAAALTLSAGKTVARTGYPCPMSGWWQCQDTEACDGTRWFARGDLLPEATFQTIKRRLKLAPKGVETYQRRSIWKLVRAASEPIEKRPPVSG